MMPNTFNLVDSMIDEAVTELNKSGWRDAPQNAVTLAAFGMMAGKVERKVDKLVKPAWVIGLSVVSAVVWLIISKALGL